MSQTTALPTGAFLFLADTKLDLICVLRDQSCQLHGTSPIFQVGD